MKNRFESEEVFTAYATIDAGYYMISEIKKDFDLVKHPIIASIDKATGYDKAYSKEKAEQVISIIEDVISAKKVIDADYSADEKLISDLKARFLTA